MLAETALLGAPPLISEQPRILARILARILGRVPARILVAGLGALLVLPGCSGGRPREVPQAAGEPTQPPSAASIVPVVPVGSAAAPAIPALSQAEQRVQQNPADLTAQLALGEAYRQSGQLPQAINRFRFVLHSAPRNEAAYRGLARVFQQANYLDREIEALKEAVRCSPGDWDAALQLAGIYSDLGWFDSALPPLRLAASAAPSEPRVYLALGAWALAHGLTDRVQYWAARGLQTDPQNPVLHSMLGEALRLQRRLPGAELEIQKAIAFSPDSTSRSRCWIDLSHLLLQRGWKPPRYGEAASAARTALQLDPRNWQAHYWLAEALRDQGQLVQAEAEYRATAEHDVQFESTAYQLGRLYARSADPQKRLRSVWLLAAATQADQNQSRYADLHTTLSAHPRDPNPHESAAIWWYVSTSQYPRAIAELRRTLELRPNDGLARRELAAVLRASGRRTEARDVSNPAFHFKEALGFASSDAGKASTDSRFALSGPGGSAHARS